MIPKYNKDPYNPSTSQVTTEVCKGIEARDLNEDMIYIKEIIPMGRMGEANRNLSLTEHCNLMK